MDRKVRIIGRSDVPTGITLSVIIDRIEHYPWNKAHSSWEEVRLNGASYAKRLIDQTSGW